MDRSEGLVFLSNILFFHHIVMILSDILNNKKTERINRVKTLERGAKFLDKIIGGLLLVEGEKDFDKFPPTAEGVCLAGYFYEAAKELRLIERGIITSEKSSVFIKKIRNALVCNFANTTNKEISLIREFFLFLSDRFLSEYRAVTNSIDEDD